MRFRWSGLGSLSVALLCLAGCWSTDSHLTKPPPVPAEYRLPPNDDARFSNPPVYPGGAGGSKKGSDPMMPGGLRGPGSNRFGAGGSGY